MSRAHSRAEGTRPRLRGPGGLAPGASTRWQAPAPALLPLLLIVAATTGCRGASQDSPLRAAAVDLSPRRDFSTPHTSPDAGALRQAPRSGRGGAQCDEIFVGGLDYHLTPADVQCAFAQFGSVLEVQVPRAETADSSNKGYSFVRYKDPRSCLLAVENMDGTILCGRKLSVNMARGGLHPDKERARAEPTSRTRAEPT